MLWAGLSIQSIALHEKNQKSWSARGLLQPHGRTLRRQLSRQPKAYWSQRHESFYWKAFSKSGTHCFQRQTSRDVSIMWRTCKFLRAPPFPLWGYVFCHPSMDTAEWMCFGFEETLRCSLWGEVRGEAWHCWFHRASEGAPLLFSHIPKLRKNQSIVCGWWAHGGQKTGSSGSSCKPWLHFTAFDGFHESYSTQNSGGLGIKKAVAWTFPHTQPQAKASAFWRHLACKTNVPRPFSHPMLPELLLSSTRERCFLSEFMLWCMWHFAAFRFILLNSLNHPRPDVWSCSLSEMTRTEGQCLMSLHVREWMLHEIFQQMAMSSTAPRIRFQFLKCP